MAANPHRPEIDAGCCQLKPPVGTGGWDNDPPKRPLIFPIAPRGAASRIKLLLHGRIAAGQPIEAIKGQESLSVPAVFLGSGKYYALEVAGDSIVDESIFDGDYALIRKANVAREGEIVVAMIDQSEATLKTFRREGSMVRLDPADRNYEPPGMTVKQAMQVRNRPRASMSSWPNM